MTIDWNTPGTAGGPGGRDRTLAVKSGKTSEKSPLFLKKIKFTPKNIFFCIYLLVMPKYWVKNYFAHGSFPEVGQKQKTERKKRRRGKKDWTMVITMAKLRMAHASTHGARKPPGPKRRGKKDWTMVITMVWSQIKPIFSFCCQEKDTEAHQNKSTAATHPLKVVKQENTLNLYFKFVLLRKSSIIWNVYIPLFHV